MSDGAGSRALHSSSDPRSEASSVLGLPSGLGAQGGGSASYVLSEANRLLLLETLGSCVSILSDLPPQATGPLSVGSRGSISGIHSNSQRADASSRHSRQAFQQRYHMSPEWDSLEQDHVNRQQYRARVKLPDGNLVQGPWAHGKKAAKREALQLLLVPPSDGAGSSATPSINGQAAGPV